MDSLKEFLAKTSDVAVTIDVWTSRDMRSYIGITAHYITAYKLQSKLLTCKRFTGAHTAENIRDCYDEILAAYSITGKVHTTVSDNASNMIRAFVTLPNLVAPQDEDEEDPEPVEEPDGDPALLEYLPPHVPCFTHTLQLVVRDGLRDIGPMGRVLAKVSRIVNFVHHSTSASELFSNDVRLQVANATRWNSQLKMIRSLLAVSDATLAQLEPQYQISAYEKQLLSELAEILTPFETATDQTQGEVKVTASLIIPCIRGLRTEMAELGDTYQCKFTRTLQSSVEKRLHKYEEMDIFQTATSLDPRFKLLWCSDAQECADVRLSLVDKVK